MTATGQSALEAIQALQTYLAEKRPGKYKGIKTSRKGPTKCSSWWKESGPPDARLINPLMLAKICCDYFIYLDRDRHEDEETLETFISFGIAALALIYLQPVEPGSRETARRKYRKDCANAHVTGASLYESWKEGVLEEKDPRIRGKRELKLNIVKAVLDSLAEPIQQTA
ncbi:hypothetical protein Micbo1qcDRAFT_169648 [Microdochium bolleyi]|uniref:Uncharacterized protein n=1 Tax=Microdochium bolleyi TaxID=196109 RepID=A0A136IJU3_9PEZI|nr:hypothetical protein Micbo1qcDRAFT_169648 [Microdochium bolleyi]